jgi:outer membrane PBP1 activator LpoA protein
VHPSRPLFLLILFASLLAVTACTGIAPQTTAPVDTELSAQARQYAARGDHAAAARLYLDKSKTAPERFAPDLRLTAAQYLAQGALWNELDEVLKTIDSNKLPAGRRDQLPLLHAELALARNEQNRALGLLQQITSPENLPDRGKKYHRIKATAYAMSGNPLEATQQLMKLDDLITDQEQKRANQFAIWEQLSILSDQALVQLQTSPPPDTLSGWMELVLMSRRTAGDTLEWSRSLADWRYQYPQHPAEQALLPAMQNIASRIGPQPKRIAVLLPFSGRTGAVAASIRDGILAARFADQLQPEIRFYDTSGDTHIWAIYQQAVQDGAEIVIGPLLKEKIQQLAVSSPLSAPVLALNQIETSATSPVENSNDSNSGIYQFGLAPEDEARQAAERILADEHFKVLAMAPQNAWGERVLKAFRLHYTELGGQVVGTASYANKSADFGESIKTMLNLTGSKQRHRAVERLFGENLEFQPRRRQDASAVFLLAFPRQARLIQPQLRFHGADDLPNYSTSHVFTGIRNASLDKDMGGIQFCDIPWLLDRSGDWQVLRNQLDTLWPDRSKRYPRLFALGIDAYRILPWLEVLENPGPGSFSGATGNLTMDAEKQLHRSLKWARFNKGIPTLLQDNRYRPPVTEPTTQQLPAQESNMSTEGQHEPQGYRESR